MLHATETPDRVEAGGGKENCWLVPGPRHNVPAPSTVKEKQKSTLGRQRVKEKVFWGSRLRETSATNTDLPERRVEFLSPPPIEKGSGFDTRKENP